MRVLLTGASGFLGRHLCEALRDRGHLIVALVRDQVGCPLSEVRTTDGVLVYGGFDQVERAIAEYEVDTVFHLAAQTQVSTAAADPTGTFEANVRGTQQVLEACRRQKVKRVVVASSDKVYGDGPVPYTEGQQLRPHGIYATSKTCADMLAQSYAREYGMSVAITRCGNLYGPGHLNWSTLIPGTVRSLLKGERPRLRSMTNKPQRDFLFVEDAVDGYLKLAVSSETGVFNFGCGRGISVGEVVETISEIMNTNLIVVHDPAGPGAGGVEIPHQWLDCARARRELDWQPQHDLVAGLKKTVDWYREYLKER